MTTPQPQRKVRIACQRCRARRIKCDGQKPACANCAKVGSPCVDVDARNRAQLIPRNAVVQARDRIRWLEEIISSKLPTISLLDGPQVDFSFLDTDVDDTEAVPGDQPHSMSAAGPVAGSGHGGMTSTTAHTNKRPYEEPNQAGQSQAFGYEAQSVASDLRTLTLNSDSTDRQYMGSSSGLYFTHLIQANSPESQSPQSRQLPGRNVAANAKVSKRDRSSTLQALASLPSKDDAHHLVELYLRYIHPDHPVLHPRSLCDALEALYRVQLVGPESLVDNSGWPVGTTPFSYNGDPSPDGTASKIAISLEAAAFHVFMVFALAASVRVAEAPMEFAPAQYYRLATTGSRDVFERTSVVSLQAAYLLAVYALIAPTNLNIWTLTHLCIAHSIDLGIHRRRPETPPAARITRELLFHSIYSLDRSIAAIQGRPLGIRDETFDVELPSIEEVKAELHASALPIEYADLIGAATCYSLHRLRLDKTISAIKLKFYHLQSDRNGGCDAIDPGRQQQSIYDELQAWRLEMDDKVAEIGRNQSEQRRLCLHLEILYHAAVGLLYQPSQVIRRPNYDQAWTCFEAAVKQIACYKSLYEEDMLQLDWRTVRSIFACGATIMYCFWTTEPLRSRPHTADIVVPLQSCVTLLTVGGVWWPSVKRGKASFQRLVDLTLEQAGSSTADEHSQRSKRRATATRLRSANDSHIPEPSSEPTQTTYPAPNSAAISNNQPINLVPAQTFHGIQQQQQYPFAEYDAQGPSAIIHDPYGYSDELQQQEHAYDHISFDPTANQYFVEPEIEAFLGNFFLDDGTWSMADGGPPLAFHFGDM